MFQTLKKHAYSYIATIIFLRFSLYCLSLQNTPTDSLAREVFSALYGLMALCGGLMGIVISRKWGGFASLMGKAIIFLSMGLLLQVFGQLAYSAYTFLFHIEIPYPSVGDIGYFGSIPMYILGGIFIARAAGIQLGFATTKGKVVAILVPTLLIAITYYFLLSKVEVDTENMWVNILNYGYPLGQAIYVTIAIMTYFLSQKVLGGIMRERILFVLFSFVVQYVADFVFLYKNYEGTWVTAGPNEFMYLLAYYLMAISLISMDNIATVLKKEEKETK